MKKSMTYIFILLSAFLMVVGCSEKEPARPTLDGQNRITITPCVKSISADVTAEVIPTRSGPTMVDFPESASLGYQDPVALFGFFLQDQSSAGNMSKGCFGETRVEILDKYADNRVTASHAADVLQEPVGGVAPTRSYESFMSNSVYVYSPGSNGTTGAYISNDMAAFWRPDAYHYFISYAPPLPDANLVEPLVLKLVASMHGVQDTPDFNFLYGRRVLQYNDAQGNSPYHKTDGATIYLSPMLGQIVFHLKCEEDLAGSAVLFGFRVKTFKESMFHLDSGRWEFSNTDDYEWVTRYYDDDYIIPTAWDAEGNAFSLSLFPNLERPGDPILVDQPNPEDNTQIVVKALQICINNTWYDVLNLEEHAGDIHGSHAKVGEIVPLVPGYKTDIYLTITPKHSGLDDWNKLLVTFSNWKREDIYEYEGVLE